MEAIIAAYKAKTDIDEVEPGGWPTFRPLTASEAVALGLADEVGEGVTEVLQWC